MLQLNGKRINGNRKIPFLTHPRVPANFEKNGSDHFSASTFPMFSTLMQAGRTTLDGGGGGRRNERGIKERDVTNKRRNMARILRRSQNGINWMKMANVT